ncbi:MAG: hypothetical protein M1828_007313 [Chrysothrix sp. TS-e1954]|nr:MAG: hypothetical protein M1828_007313 [Chrysothrix sp. TS-e1954]
MALGVPAIACIGVIGKHNNPLYIALFSPEERDELEYQFMLSSCLDIFEARAPNKTVDHDFGLLQALDERIAMYGWLTNTGVKFVIVVDMEGRPANANEARNSALIGVRDADLKPAFRALHTAYIRLLRNPFYDPEEHLKRGMPNAAPAPVSSPQFGAAVDRIGKIWHPRISTM